MKKLLLAISFLLPISVCHIVKPECQSECQTKEPGDQLKPAEVARFKQLEQLAEKIVNTLQTPEYQARYKEHYSGAITVNTYAPRVLWSQQMGLTHDEVKQLVTMFKQIEQAVELRGQINKEIIKGMRCSHCDDAPSPEVLAHINALKQQEAMLTKDFTEFSWILAVAALDRSDLLSASQREYNQQMQQATGLRWASTKSCRIGCLCNDAVCELAANVEKDAACGASMALPMTLYYLSTGIGGALSDGAKVMTLVQNHIQALETLAIGA